MERDEAKPIMIYPKAGTRKLIEEEAARKGWKLGPTVLRIVEKFFRRREKNNDR
jgi:hypothetical protein